jgi:hypothetical protein
MLPDFDRADRNGEFWSYPRESGLVFASRVTLPDTAGPEGWS